MKLANMFVSLGVMSVAFYKFQSPIPRPKKISGGFRCA